MSAWLRVIYKRSGGLAHFPGLAAGREVDASGLGEEARATLLRLCRAHQAAGCSGRPGHPDAMTERVVVEAAGKRRELSADDFCAAGQEALWERIKAAALAEKG